MSKRAEERALEKYPIYWAKAVMPDGNIIELDANETTRNVFVLGYEQAEKDIIAIIRSPYLRNHRRCIAKAHTAD